MTAAGPATPSGGNPFSPVAVARVSDVIDITIDTDAVREAIGHVSAFLESTMEDSGNVIAVVGDYGTGKTHLAARLHQLTTPAGVTTRTMYLEATAAGFLSVYRRFISEGLTLDVVRERVNFHYADIVADALGPSQMTASVVEQMRRREVDPAKVVEELALPASELSREAQRRLAGVTASEDFGTALALLLRPQFEDAVWTWLCGGSLASTLLERGIKQPIDTNPAALLALGSFARLFSDDEHRFLLLLDEADNVLSASDGRGEVQAAFKNLLQLFASSGAMLVLFGLPGFVGLLTDDVRERIGRVVTLPGLDQGQVGQFIERTQELHSGRRELAPFTQDVVQHLVGLTGGNPRHVIKLCHLLYRQAQQHGLMVDAEMVLEAAREVLTVISPGDVANGVRRHLDARGWRYHRDHFLGPLSPVEFWLPYNDEGHGCAILISGSVLNDEDVAGLTRRVTAIRSAQPESELLLIVGGVLRNQYAVQLREVFSSGTLQYSERTFSEDVKALFEAMRRRVERYAAEDTLVVVQERIEQINRQQSSIFNLIDQLVTRVEDMRSASSRRLDALQQSISDLTASGAQPAWAGTRSLSKLPPDVARLFDDLLAELAELVRWDSLTDAFGGEDNIDPMLTRLRTDQLRAGIGVAALIQQTVLAFREAVTAWCPAPGSAPSADDLARLEDLCTAYDSICDHLSVLRVEQAVQSTSQPRRHELDNKVAAFAATVRRALRRSFPA